MKFGYMATRKHNLPAVNKGQRLTKRQKIKLAKEVCELYQTDQYTLESCLHQVGIRSDSTWYKWTADLEEVADLFNKAKKEKTTRYRAGLVERARTTLERYLDGFTVEIVEEEGMAIGGGNGEAPQIQTTRIKRKQKYIRPSVGAAMYVLNNMDGRNFSKNPEPHKAGNEKMPTKIDIEIFGGAPPITREDDITDD